MAWVSSSCWLFSRRLWALHPLYPLLFSRQTANRRCRGLAGWLAVGSLQSIKAARSAALAARTESDLKQPNRKKPRRTAAPSASVCARREKKNGARQFQSPWGLPSETHKGKGVHPKKACVVTRVCTEARANDRYSPYLLRRGCVRFFLLSFSCSSSSHTFLSLRKAYTFFIILDFTVLGETSIPHTFSWKSPFPSKSSIRPRYKKPLAALRQTEHPNLERQPHLLFSSRGHSSQ